MRATERGVTGHVRGMRCSCSPKLFSFLFRTRLAAACALCTAKVLSWNEAGEGPHTDIVCQATAGDALGRFVNRVSAKLLKTHCVGPTFDLRTVLGHLRR